ncbi:MAG: class I SAM-dependent methyltransferase [Hyphomicrobiaceae bacterium]|nr:class I SAM-dependent methyltransferase [Hyphomicrobiaceae bacterium]
MWQPLRLLFASVVRSGRLEVVDARGRRHSFGDGTGPPLTLVIHDRRTERRLALSPQLVLGEAYMDGTLSVEGGRIYDVLDRLVGNLGAGPLPRWAGVLDRVRKSGRRLQQLNTLRRARRNVAHHYDIDASIYALFLDADRQYSCGYFAEGCDGLEDAQRAKKRHIAAKLALGPGQTVLDIGCGWGGLALYLARHYGLSVTGITLSTEQLRLAEARADAAGLARRVHFALEDFRKVTGTFDRIVSVGMLEHVGINHYDTYFQQIGALLSDSGVALVHTIARSDSPSVTNPFIAKYIFPGGYIPALSEVMPAIERSGLLTTDVEVLRLHYAETLRHWRERFLANWSRAAAIRDERFCRMWEFYLAGSEVAFRHQHLVVLQIQLARRIDTLPLTRAYIAREEARLAGLDRLDGGAHRMAGE